MRSTYHYDGACLRTRPVCRPNEVGLMSLGSTLRRILDDQRVRFLIVGGFNTAVGFGVFVAVDFTLGRWITAQSSAVLSSVVTLVVAHLLAAVVAFVLYRRFVFRVSGNVVVDFLRFESVYLVPLGVNLVVLPAVVAAGAPAILAQAVILVLMTLVSYFGHRYFSFRRKPTALPVDVRDEAGDSDPTPVAPRGDERSTDKVTGS